MGKRRTADQIKRLLREADRDLAKGLTVSDKCRKLRRQRKHFGCAGEVAVALERGGLPRAASVAPIRFTDTYTLKRMVQRT